MKNELQNKLYMDYHICKCFDVIWEVFYDIPELKFEKIKNEKRI